MIASHAKRKLIENPLIRSTINTLTKLYTNTNLKKKNLLKVR